MSRNGKYYIKKINKSSTLKGIQKIDNFLSQANTISAESSQSIDLSHSQPDSELNSHDSKCPSDPQSGRPDAELKTNDSDSECPSDPQSSQPDSELSTHDYECPSDSQSGRSDSKLNRSDTHDSECPSDSHCDQDESEILYTATPLFIPNVHAMPPEKKIKTDHKVKRSTFSDYERNYDWLYFNVTKKGYMCKVCEMFPLGLSKASDSQTPFLSGTSLGSHPTRKLEKHQSSSNHQRAVQRFAGSKEQIQYMNIESALKKKTTDDINRNRAYMESLVDTLFLIVRKHWALDSVQDLMKHLQALNCPTVTTYMNRNTVTYTSSTSVTDVLIAMGAVFEKKVIDDINNAKYIALLADESTDEANRTQFAVLLRYLSQGSVNDHFAGLINVQKTDAESLMSALENFVVSKGIDMGKIMFVGFDGCNVMSGEHTGLQRRFRHRVPHSVYINCRSHRLALCVKHLLKDFPILEEVDSVMLLIYKMFEYSPQKFAVFKEVQASYGMKEVVMVRAAATRWLSHGSACQRIISRYEQIIDTLDTIIQEKRTPELTGVRIALTSKNTVAAILILSDLLKPINIFCKYLQGSVDFTTVSLKVKDLIDTLTDLAGEFRATLDGPNDLQFSKLTQMFQVIDERAEFARAMRGHDVNTPEQLVEELAVPMVFKLIQELEDGFRCSPVLNAFSILNIRNLPDTIHELADYGNVEIKTLTNHYGAQQIDNFQGHEGHAPPLFNKVEAENEYQAFRHQMFMHRRRNPDASLLDMFVQDPVLSEIFPCMDNLALLSSLIPTSTASVERCFSLMNSICTANRNRLSQETLSTLMLLCREGPDTLSQDEKSDIINFFQEMKRREVPMMM